MFRFFVNIKHGNAFVLSSNILRHIKVARIENQKFICIFEKMFYECYLENNQAIIIKKLNRNPDVLKEVIIAISYIKSKQFEWMIQKTTELGVTKIIPMLSKNVSQKINNQFSKKITRWNSIALHASQQSFRSSVPEITNITDFKSVIKKFQNVPNKYIAYTKCNNAPKSTFRDNSIFLIGPEGGFANEEIILAQKNNFEIISLGKRILRTETVPLFLLSRIYE